MRNPSKSGPTITRVNELLDFDRATGVFTWKVTDHPNPYAARRAGSLRSTGYRAIRIDYVIYQEHRLVWLMTRGEWPDRDIDHINGVPTDNRPENLRPATASENGANSRMHKNNTHGFKGVSRHKRQGWFARICINRTIHFLGYHDTPEAAHAAYVEAASRLRGEFARPT
jgi:hypothetical protein